MHALCSTSAHITVTSPENHSITSPFSAGVTQQLVDAGAIDVLLTVMDLAPQSAGLQEAATYALCNICATPGNLTSHIAVPFHILDNSCINPLCFLKQFFENIYGIGSVRFPWPGAYFSNSWPFVSLYECSDWWSHCNLYIQDKMSEIWIYLFCNFCDLF